jgi:transposase InsO family protein
MNSQCQVGLIDMQSNPDRDMKFILVYQDHLTKFVLLRSLHSKRADEVAYHLLDIFTTFAAPNILHSDSGREFCNQIMNSLCKMWNDIKIIHGKPRHSESEDGSKIDNIRITDIKDEEFYELGTNLPIYLMQRKFFKHRKRWYGGNKCT